jgi:hypothetical protein
MVISRNSERFNAPREVKYAMGEPNGAEQKAGQLNKKDQARSSFRHFSRLLWPSYTPGIYS